MTDSYSSEETEFCEEVRPSVSNLVRRFEDHSKTPNQSHIVASSSSPSDTDSDEVEECVQKSISCSNNNNTMRSENIKTDFTSNASEKPPVPAKRVNVKDLQPRPPLRRSITNRNPLINVDGRIAEQDQDDVAPPLPIKTYESHDLPDNPDKVPIPRVRKPINKSKSLLGRKKHNVDKEPLEITPPGSSKHVAKESLDLGERNFPRENLLYVEKAHTEGIYDVAEENPEIHYVPSIPPRRPTNVTRKSQYGQEARNEFITLRESIPSLPPSRPQAIYVEEANNKDKKRTVLESLPQARTAPQTLPRNSKISRDHQGVRNDFVSSSTSSTRPRSMDAHALKNRGAIRRSQTMSTRTKTKGDGEIYSKINIRNSNKTLSPRNKIGDFAKFDESTHIYENVPPPLPPRSSNLKRTSAILERNLSVLDAVEKLNELKSSFASTNADLSNTEKYNKSIMLIDVMIEAIEENFLEKEVEYDAWYSNMKDFVHKETTDYLKENSLNSNWNIPYDKLLNKMLPKFVENHVNTDPNLNQESDEEESYETYESDNDSQELDCGDTMEKTPKILKEMLQNESNYLTNLQSYINEYSELESFRDIIPKLQDILTIENEFNNKLQEKDDDLLWTLKTFSDFESLFAMYAEVDFFCRKIKNMDHKSASINHEDFKSASELATLLLNQLKDYRFFVKNIDKDMKDKEEEFKVKNAANEVLEMLSTVLEMCNDTVSTASVSSSQHLDEEENSLNDDGQGQDETTHILSSLLPASYDQSEYGTLLLRDFFKIDNRRTYYKVFLFEKMIVVTKETSKDNLIYKYGLKLDQFVLVSQGKNKKVIKLKDYFKSKYSNKDVIIKMEAKSEEIEAKWRAEIYECLWNQLKQKKQERRKTIKLIPL